MLAVYTSIYIGMLYVYMFFNVSSDGHITDTFLPFYISGIFNTCYITHSLAWIQ